MAFGDSLVAGYGLPRGRSFPEELQNHLRTRGHDVKVVNAGVSGDTSAAGRARLAWALADGADMVVLELGANDALRGLPPDELRDNLDAMLADLKQRGLPVLLCGMRAPPNSGADYVREFDRIFPELAEKHGVAFYPFFLDGVAAKPALNQPDGIHPNSKGVKEIVRRIAPYVERVMATIGR